MNKSERTSNNKSEETVPHKIMDSIQGKDEPMEVNHPDAPIWLVFGSYPIVALLAIAILIIFIWATKS